MAKHIEDISKKDINSQIDIYQQLAHKSWQIILSSINEMRENKKTLEEIAKILDVKNRSLISEWINGNRIPSTTAFVNIIKYLDLLGYKIDGTQIIKKSENNNPTSLQKDLDKIEDLKDEIKKIKKENAKLKEKLEVIKDITSKKKKK